MRYDGTKLNLVVFQSFDEFLACLQQRDLRPRVLDMFEFHRRPRRMQLFEHLLHAHLLDRFVHDVLDLILKLVQVQRQQIGQRRLVIQYKLHLSKKSTQNKIICTLTRQYSPTYLPTRGQSTRGLVNSPTTIFLNYENTTP